MFQINLPLFNPLIKKKMEKKIDINKPSALMDFITGFSYFFEEFFSEEEFREIIILCIGTDRSTGDSLGPIIGSKLNHLHIPGVHVLGNLDNPVHAVNLVENLNNIKDNYKSPFIIAIDASLGKLDHVGHICICEGPSKPGAGVKKDLPFVGNFNITGIVNVGGFMEYLVLQNTRLGLVMKMADIISKGIYCSFNKIFPAEMTRRRF